jgi:DNA repair protein SbcC/Rad50
MIPISLTISNFLSYGDAPQEIFFSDYSLVCLSGQNGNGKSAFLESISWVLWGVARKNQGAVKSDDSVLRIGAKSMFVHLVFSVSGFQYLIKRSYEKRGSRGFSELHFFTYDFESESVVKELSEGSQKETQEIINKAIGFDYETFINTLFLRQGFSNEFSKKTPKERKELLGRILGIDKIDTIRDRILSDIRVKQQELDVLNHLKLSYKNKDVGVNLTLKKSELDVKKKEYLRLKNNVEIERKKVSELERKNVELFEKYSKFHIKYKGLSDLLNEANISFQKMFQNYNFFKKTHFKIRDLRISVNEMSEKVGIKQYSIEDIEKEFALLNEQSVELSSFLSSASNRCERDIENLTYILNVKKKSVNESIKKCELEVCKKEKDINKNNLRIKEIDLETNKLNKCVDSFSLGKSTISRMIEVGKKISSRYFKLDVDKTYASKILDDIVKKKKCVFCKTTFSKEVSEKIRLKVHIKSVGIKKKLEAFERRYNRWISLFDNLGSESSLSDEFMHYQKNIVDLKLLNMEKGNVDFENNKLVNDVLNLNQEINGYGEDILGAEKDFNKRKKEIENNFKSSCKSTEKDFAHISFKIDKIDPLRKNLFKINELEADVEYKKFNKKSMRKKLKYNISKIRKLESELEKLRSSSKKYEQKKAEISKQLTDVKSKLSTLEIALKDEHELICIEHARYLSAEEELKKNKKELDEIENKLSEINKYYDIRSRLASLLSKDMMQAALIENIIPFLEDEANRILHMLTNGKYSIHIESIKDLKSGKMKETLDIMISDNYGMRYYEFFSGGESFRIDLALRIALSKILAKRSGAKIQTFIIDEGFGSQDNVSLESVVQMLYALQEEFDLIIVVSHLTSMRDEFPVHFVVNKTISGSQINIVN